MTFILTQQKWKHMRGLSTANKIIFFFIILFFLNITHAQETPMYAFRFPVGGRLLFDPIIDNERVWILAEGNQLYTVTETGTAIGKGTIAIPKPVYAVPDKLGRILITDATSKAELYNENCRLVWSIKLNGKLSIPPLFDSKGMLYICIDTNVLCYTPGGKLRTHFKLSDIPYSGCIATINDSETIFFSIQKPGNQSAVTGISTKDFSATTWQTSQAASQFALSTEGAVFSFGNKILLFSKIDEQPIALAEFSAPIIAMDFNGIYGAVLLQNNILCLISHGKVLWSTQTKGDANTKVYLSQERIILYNKKRALSFSLDGELFREINITKSTTNLIPAKSGVIFSGGEDWILYAYQFEKFRHTQEKSNAFENEFPVQTILASEMLWLSAGYSDNSFVPYLDRAELALQRLEPLSQTDYAMIIVAAGSLDADNIPDPQKNLSIPLRVKACIILGADGNPDSIPYLLETALKEKDETLVAAALNAIADIGLDPHDIVLKKLAQNFSLPLSSQPALAVIRCITKLTLAKGVQTNKLEALSILTKLQDSRFPELVRKKAQEAQFILMRQ